jgi:hypothetical protein
LIIAAAAQSIRQRVFPPLSAKDAGGPNQRRTDFAERDHQQGKWEAKN